MPQQPAQQSAVNTGVSLADFSVAELEQVLAIKRQQEGKNRQAYKDLVVETVPQIVGKLQAISDLLAEEKKTVFIMAKTLLTMKNEVFATKSIEGQQSHTFSDDKSSFTIGYRVIDNWDDTVTAGVEKVTTALQSRSKDPESGILVNMVFNLLKRNKAGNLSASRVMDLQKMVEEFADPQFTDGVKIITSSYKPKRSVWFIEAETKNGISDRINIPLSMSAVDFPADFVFDFDPPKPTQ